MRSSIADVAESVAAEMLLSKYTIEASLLKL